MDTTIINFKTRKDVKKQAQKIAKQMGLNLTSVMNIYLQDFIRTKELKIKLEEPTLKTSKDILSSIKELKEGNASPTFNTAEDAIKWLDKDAKKHAN